MPAMKELGVDLLCLDLDNYRTIHQKNETHAINTMVSISPDRFWALLDSLLDDGYHATENIIVLERDNKFVVKEGNRRIAALKIIFGIIKDIKLTDTTMAKIKTVSEDWKKENRKVPCSIFKISEAQNVERIIALTHAKGEKAGRDIWTAVARARYNRDQKGMSEPGLDLLEKYLLQGKNLSENQAERWSGDYPLTVLMDAIQKIVPHLEFKTTIELVNAYPKKNKSILDKIVYDVGIQNLGFKEIRDKQLFFGEKYSVPFKTLIPMPHGSINSENPQVSALPVTSNQNSPVSTVPNVSNSSSPTTVAKLKAQPLNDPKAVYRKLKAFYPRGNGRDKVVALLNEMKKLKVDVHPHAFCFLLRSMYEISAKAYCADFKNTGGPSPHKNGIDRPLADLLRDITSHMTNDKKDKDKMKLLHGSIAELAKKEGLLSVTSLNQLVHNPSFSISPNDICILFSNIFPLLEEMNK